MRDGSDIRGAICEGSMDTNISAVVPIEYGVSLMEELGLEIF
jgi:serine protease Do